MGGRNGPMESRRVTLDGVGELHFVASHGPVPPERPPVVLVHGFGMSSRYMLPLAEELASDFMVFVPDLPGFGRSDKPRRVLDIAELADALAAWMAKLDLPRAVMIGNSFGCQVLVEFAVRHGEGVECLVLQGPTADPGARTVRQLLWLQLRNSRHDATSRMIRIALGDFLTAGPRRLLGTLRHLVGHRMEDRLPRVEAPTLVLRGTRDPLVPRAWAKEAADLLPHGRLVELRGSAHIANFHAPRQIARVVRTFVLRPQAGGVGRLELARASI